MYWVKNPKWIQFLFPRLIFSMSSKKPVLYLTFDDGPIPEVTPWVLRQLEKYKAKASFFCVGDNVEKNPTIYQQILAAGHSVGNHTYNHLHAGKTKVKEYVNNVEKCAGLVSSELFRPPYGRIRPKITKRLYDKYRIVMWDVLSGDFDTTLSPDKCLRNVIKHAGPGSIVVFHDSLKAKERLTHVLPRVLKYFSLKGYQFKAL